MIPQDMREAVNRGLQEAFGATQFEDISKITRGRTSSLVFRIVVSGSTYLLKIITRAEDPSRHYACMKTAAEAGLAPRVLYTNAEDRISITDFVESEVLTRSEALLRLPAILRNLHALPRFDRAPFNTTCTFLLNKNPLQDTFLEKFHNANLLTESEYAEFFRRLADLAAVYPRNETDLVSSHNDLFKPDNILFDGRQVWLVDWEAAFLNDRYADLAVVANQLATNDAEERAFLQEYFRAPPDQYQLARFHLMQQISHLFYTMAFLYQGSMGKPIDWTGAIPEFADFHRRLWAGEIHLVDRDVKIVYARVHWERLLQNLRRPRYHEAIRVVSDGEYNS